MTSQTVSASSTDFDFFLGILFDDIWSDLCLFQHLIVFYISYFNYNTSDSPILYDDGPGYEKLNQKHFKSKNNKNAMINWHYKLMLSTLKCVCKSDIDPDWSFNIMYTIRNDNW